MINFFERIPSSAVVSECDGHQYGYGLCRMTTLPDGRHAPAQGGGPYMRRVSFEQNGEAYLYLGCAGDAIACIVNLPFSITYEFDERGSAL